MRGNTDSDWPGPTATTVPACLMGLAKSSSSPGPGKHAGPRLLASDLRWQIRAVHRVPLVVKTGRRASPRSRGS
ncbi:MAG: hypothetical protein EOO36_06880 [Cytophagaceae bacterium]|nr:MAG: hypothetical protein EOO36_06880 [Cytophagaceae bacterium]